MFSLDDPPGLKGIVELALDMHWAWDHGADHIWQRLDPVLWEATRNPWLLLKSVGTDRLESLAQDPAFVRQLRACRRDRKAELRAPAWFDRAYAGKPFGSVAYFSMEFGLSEALPLYAGGLGVLAGDHLKTANDLGVPVAGVGLLYSRGYFRQAFDAAGNQIELYPVNDPDVMPVLPARDAQGAWLRVSIPLPGRTLWLRAWVARIGRVRLYLLDSNDPQNSPADRGITAELYGGGPEMRLQQELCLGAGGWRLISALGLEPEVCHLNEGHAAFAALERARGIAATANAPFDDALTAGRAGTIFTTHTAVAAGFDRFDRATIAPYLECYAADLAVSPDALFALGAEPDGTALFNMAYLAIRTSGRVNAVSLLHEAVSRELFHDLFPRRPFVEIPIRHVTNGVHTPSWDSKETDRVWTEACGKSRWLGTFATVEDAIGRLDDATLATMRSRNRTNLIEFVRTRLSRDLASRGAGPDVLEQARSVLHPDVLTICFARRFTGYKRVDLLLHDEERLVRLLTNDDRPVQIVLAGKAHPEDAEGKQLVRRWVAFSERPDVRRRVVFLSDYDLLVAEMLVQGADLWLNTPLRPWEACGTSGMKVLVNGGLNFSELDGWWSEAFAPDLGWALGDRNVHADSGAWSASEAETLYERLENDIAPMFYERETAGISRAWLARVRASMATLTTQFSANRMTREYVDALYVPAAEAYRHRVADDLRIARELQRWHATVKNHWNELHFDAVEAANVAAGSTRFTVALGLGALDSGSVRVELYAEPAEPGMAPECVVMKPGPKLGGITAYTADVTTGRPHADFTPRVMPYHPEAILPIEDTSILWQR